MKLLIPLDGSKFAESVLNPVTKLIDLTGGDVEVHLITVVNASRAHTTWITPPPTMRDVERMWSPTGRMGRGPIECSVGVAVETINQALDHLTTEAKDYLVAISTEYFGGKARIRVILGEDPASEIVRFAQAQKADLIALATHGRTGVAGLLMGGVASRLLHSRVAPVLLQRPDGLGDGMPHNGSSG